MRTSRKRNSIVPRNVTRGFYVVAAILLMTIVSLPSRAAAQSNLLLNPDLTEGSGNSPANWQPQSFRSEKDPNYTAPLDWFPNHSPAELMVQNPESDDARWVQALDLQPGWYHFTGEIRTESVGLNDIGANLSILEAWDGSHDVRGTQDWQPEGFYLQVGPDGAKVTFACRLGMYSNVNTGTAFFRNLSVTKVAGPTNGDPVFQYVPPPPQ